VLLGPTVLPVDRHNFVDDGCSERSRLSCGCLG
jgi:hypothetical protein